MLVTPVRRGTLSALGAYALWGLFPLFFHLLAPAGALEVLAHRVVWTLAVVGALVLALRGARRVRAVLADRRRTWLLVLAAVVIAINWGVYIYAVTSGQVVEASLGYFMNPIVTVLLGVLLLGEQLRRMQWAALGLAGVAVLVLSFENGHPPLLALVLAVSFGTYGLAKKKAGVGAVESLTVETLVLTPFALLFLVALGVTGRSTFAGHGAGHAELLVLSGLVTTVPLLLFGAAATRVPLTTLGVLQYLTPSLQFVLGVLVFDEAMPLGRLLGFGLVWCALLVFTADLLHTSSRARRAHVPAPVAVAA